ncbi:hypothetical protein [Thermogymnomonas acidicola]|uniref:hypothetical protein n=1 Tax=Thermogymnomonas acidicola TaxID=399579 RepID=UPI001396AE33|nr:hypothetical protein [Thermogymnomonas acidicola]
MFVKCVTVSRNRLMGIGKPEDLLYMDIDEVFLVDMDALTRYKLSFHFYREISRFCEVTVLNMPARVQDLIDTLVSGASRVVVGRDVDSRLLSGFMQVSDSVVLSLVSRNLVDEFIRLGGGDFFSLGQTDIAFRTLYNAGPPVIREGVKNIEDFPEGAVPYLQ